MYKISPALLSRQAATAASQPAHDVLQRMAHAGWDDKAHAGVAKKKKATSNWVGRYSLQIHDMRRAPYRLARSELGQMKPGFISELPTTRAKRLLEG